MENVDKQTTDTIFKTHKKNTYVRLEPGSYPRKFKEQVEKAMAALATDDLRSTKMIRRNTRSGTLDLTIGFDKRNWWFENKYIKRGHVASFRTANEAMEALRTIWKAAMAGEFDSALEALCIQRQEHADVMMENRKVCGFHRLPAQEPLKLLEAPMQPLPGADSRSL